MDTLFLWCAVGGGTVLILQTVLMLMGLGDTDLDVDDVDVELSGDEANIFFKVLSIKTVVAFFTFFGLTGLLGQSMDLQISTTLMIAIGAGVAAVFLVYYLMKGLLSLQSNGTLVLDNAIGKTGEVYLRIPPVGAGSGKVNVIVQGRSVECSATSVGPEIPTGARVQITAALGGRSVEVVPLDNS